MTYAELVKKLTKKGIKFLAHGANHDIYYNPLTGGKSPISRHWNQQVPPGTLHSILKKLGTTI